MAIGIGFKVRGFKLNTGLIISRKDRATQRVLSRFGSFVRRAAKQSIRRSKKPSQPGKPPRSHTGFLKKLIIFNYDARRRAVVVGPIRLGNAKGIDVPRVLEEGGIGIIRRKGAKPFKVRIRPRPYMGPALAKELPGLPALWKNSVTR